MIRNAPLGSLFGTSFKHVNPRVHPHGLRSITGLVLTGKYNSDDKKTLEVSACAKEFDRISSSKLSNSVAVSKIKGSRTFYGLHENYAAVAVAVLSESGNLDYDNASRNMNTESLRSAIGAAVQALMADEQVDKIEIDNSVCAKTAAEASHLAIHRFDHLKTKKRLPPILSPCSLSSTNESTEWDEGSVMGKCQNFSRFLMEMPANHMTPTKFVETVKEKVESEGLSDIISVIVRDREWISEQKMGSFLSVSAGSAEPPFLLELHYRNSESDPICLVGKGVTFDTGGISIKPSKGMDAMRADMGGAACVAGATIGAAQLNLPINLITLIPLCENMPSGSSTKPGDVVTAMNGITIQVDNTDAEGRLILADSLCYADTFKPAHVIDMATLTGAMAVALGGECVGTYSTCNTLWNALERGGYNSGDRLWRMPLFKEYADSLKSATADVNNISSGPYGGSITAAKFLQKFVKCKSWAHLDIAGVMDSTDSMSYLSKGMSGRPTRSVIEALKELSK